MLFMGEEWGSSSPFQFFSSHPGAGVGQGDGRGAQREFAEHGWDPTRFPTRRILDVLRSKLNWDEIGEGEHGRLRRIYHQLIALRHAEPDLANPWLDHLRVDYDEDRRWMVMYRGSLAIACNLGTDGVDVRSPVRSCFLGGNPSRRENYAA